MMNPAASSRAISSPIALRLSSAKRRKDCLTGLASGRTCKACSASSLGTPGMSFGDHAKMSRFSRRNSTSALSYAGLRPTPTETQRVGSDSSSRIFLVSCAGLKLMSAVGR